MRIASAKSSFSGKPPASRSTRVIGAKSSSRIQARFAAISAEYTPQPQNPPPKRPSAGNTPARFPVRRSSITTSGTLAVTMPVPDPTVA